MAPTALITGITGQDGSYLAELLLDKGYEVIGIHRRSSTVTFERINHLMDRLTMVPADLLDEASMIRVLRQYKPVEIYNLAAQSFVQTSFNQPVLTGHRPRRDPAPRRHPAHRSDRPLLPGQLQ
jgi:GDPmannose 4,6-dehydratase